MALHIHDGNWEVRRAYEVDTTGLAMRNLFDVTFFSPEPHIWVFDGRNAKRARRDVYPEYKANRTPGSDEFYKTMDVFKRLMSHCGKMTIEIPGYEGDDVIANLVKSTWGTEILLHANDGDYLTLCNDFVKMTNPPAASTKAAPEDMRLFKTLVGDPSDNIPGLPGFGKGGGVRGGGFQDLSAEHKATWCAFFEAYPWAKEMQAPSIFPYRENLGLTEGQFERFMNCWSKLCAYWRIVNFLEIPENEMQHYVKMGVNNYAEADKMLKGIMQ